MRKADITRKTAETEISVAVNLDGTGVYAVKTGVGFFDHMLDQLARHSLIDITLAAKGLDFTPHSDPPQRSEHHRCPDPLPSPDISHSDHCTSRRLCCGRFQGSTSAVAVIA